MLPEPVGSTHSPTSLIFSFTETPNVTLTEEFSLVGTVVSVESNGTKWSGEISDLSTNGFTICVDGCPPISQRSSLQIILSLHKKKSTFFVEFLSKHDEKLTKPYPSPLLNLRLEIRPEHVHEILYLCQCENMVGLPPLLSFRFSRHETPNLVRDWHTSDVGMQEPPWFYQVGITGNQETRSLVNTAQDPSLLQTHLSPPVQTPSPTECVIQSDRVTCFNQHGHEIVGYHDFPLKPEATYTPMVILSPGYGETKREYITLAYYLATNGFHVIRFDHTRHVGDSEGTHAHTTLTSIKDDMDTMIQFVKGEWGDVPLVLVATSLAGRAALKLIGESNKVDFLILIAGIINVQQTLKAVHQEDLVGDFQKGIRRGNTNVLGFNVEADQWLHDAVVNQFATLDSTIADMKQLQIPQLWFSGEQDSWNTREDMDTIHREVATTSLQSMIIPDGLHRLLENPKKAKAVYREIVAQCGALGGNGTLEMEIQDPSRRAIGLQNRIEREASKMKPVLPSSHLRHFWQDYLHHFHAIAQVGDYRQLLDQVYQSLAFPNHPTTILDAGCGNGTLANFISLRQFWDGQKHHNTPGPIHYVGLDFVSEALQGAMQTISQKSSIEQEENESPFSSSHLTTSFVQGNLNQPLPFQDGQFDRVVSNLVIGYLENISSTVKEMFRVLAPGGTLVLTNLKPNSDLTQVYRNYVDRTDSQQDIEEGRHLLHNSGKIRHAESEGVFHFYDQEEWQSLFEECGIADVDIHTTFADQAFLAVAKKPYVGVNAQQAVRDIRLTQQAV